MAEIEYKIKTATESNIETLLTACSNDFVPALAGRVDIPTYAAKLYAKAITFEAWNNNELIGLIASYFNSDTRQAFITIVSVQKQFQGAGVAAQLLHQCLSHARDRNLAVTRLEVNEKNERAVRFYQKHGFIVKEKENDSLFMESCS